MVKKFASLALVGMLAIPAAALAESVEDRLAALEEKSESWDLSSRIQWSGDFRFRADYVTAEAPGHYTALDIARGSLDFVDVFTLFGTESNFATSTVGVTAAEMGAFYTATLGDLFGGTASADALSAMSKLQGVSGLGAMFAIMPSLLNNNPAMTITDVATAFNGIFGGGKNAVDPMAVASFMKTLSVADRNNAFNALGYVAANNKKDYDNDTIYTNRFRLNMRAKAMENLEFKARLAMYKVWGMQNNAVDYTYNNGLGGGPFMLSSLAFDGSSTRQPKDNVMRVDRAFMNWNAIGGSPVWFSIGRRPVTDGPPAHIRMGTATKMATPVAYMDYPFDGASLGYAYENLFGIQDAPGRVRLCYGRGFEGGPTENSNGINDVDFGGLSWDVYSKGDRFFNFQSFGAFNMFNVPDNISFVNPFEFAKWELDSTQYNPLDSTKDLQLNRTNLGNIYHTSSVYMSKVEALNYFVTLGWSRTDAKGYDELGTSLLGSWWDEPTDRDGYSVLVGVRYDLDDMGLKFGAEYNWGSEYWISFTPGHDDLYASKLATRGSVVELYTIWDIPAGEKISQFSDAFIRLGYQHYDYEYTGSGFWLGKPQKIEDLQNDPMNAQFYVPVDTMDQIYLTMEAWF
ncbi:MAG: DUF3373 domain-containing protein [Proteobacteria bacterium]|nr:DUF3373 domain-containing protein [Pseudomonadota bacterium]MBU1738341.1 DUF3373 domain-containing protein [Pseudomonadota bacterium]